MYKKIVLCNVIVNIMQLSFVFIKICTQITIEINKTLIKSIITGIA